jgi:hypothetical protein
MLCHHCFSTLFRICHKKVQENQVGLKLNGTHPPSVYDDDDVYLLGDNTDNM